MFLRRSKIVPNVAKAKKTKKKEPDSVKAHATVISDQESANKEITPVETETTENQSSVNNLRNDTLPLEPPQQVTAEPGIVETHDTPAETHSLSRSFLSSQDESASSADEAHKKSKVVNLPKFRKYKPRITPAAVNKVLQKPSTSSIQPQEVANHQHASETHNVTATVTSNDGKSIRTPSTHLLARPELSVSPSKHLIPAAPHCVPVTTDASSSEDEGVIDPYDPNNPQGAKSDRERGRHRKNQRIKKTFVGGKPTAMIDYIFFNPKANPMVHPLSEKVVSSDISKEEEEIVDDPGQSEPEAVPAPQLTIGADGKLILDEKSLTIERKEAREGREALSRQPVTTATGFSSTKRKSCKRKKWTDEETLFFYKCLTSLGSDFESISNYFPGCARHQIKLKFKLEEKRNPHLIDKAFKSKLDFGAAELDAEFLKIAERAKEERELKKNKRNKGQPGRPPAKKKSRTQRKKKGPKGRCDYYLESSTENSAEESNASFSDEDFFGDNNSQSQTGEERKPTLRGSIKQEKADLHSGRLSSQQRSFTPNCSQSTMTIDLLSPQISEDLVNSEHIAYLEITESNVVAGRTLDPSELHVADVESIINSDSQALMSINDSTLTEVASEVAEQLPVVNAIHNQATSNVSISNLPAVIPIDNVLTNTNSPVMTSSSKATVFSAGSTCTIVNPSSTIISTTTTQGSGPIKHISLVKNTSTLLPVSKDSINVNKESGSISSVSSLLQTSSVPNPITTNTASSLPSSRLNQLLSTAPNQQSPTNFDHRKIPNRDGIVSNIISRVQKPETIVEIEPVSTTSLPQSTTSISATYTGTNTNNSRTLNIQANSSSVTTHTTNSLPDSHLNQLLTTAVLNQQPPTKFDHRVIPNRDGAGTNIITSRVQNPETILEIEPVSTISMPQTSMNVSATTRMCTETVPNNNRPVDLPKNMISNSITTNIISSLPSITGLHNQLTTVPNQQSTKFDHRVIPNNDGTVLNIVSRVQKPEIILGIEPLPTTSVSQIPTTGSATIEVSTGTVITNPISCSVTTNSTSSLPSVTGSTTLPNQQSPTKFDHRVIPNNDGTVLNIVSRVQKPETILGIEPLPTISVSQASTSEAPTSSVSTGTVPRNNRPVDLPTNPISNSSTTNSTSSLPSITGLHNQLTTFPNQQSPTKFDHRVIPNNDGTVLNIVSRVQKPETILGIEPLPTTSVSQIPTTGSAIIGVSTGTVTTNLISCSVTTNSTSSLPSVTGLTTLPNQLSPTKFDHRVIPNNDGTVLNIVSRVQKPETILGIEPLPTISVSQASTSEASTMRVSTGTDPCIITVTTAACNLTTTTANQISSSLLTNTTRSLPIITSSVENKLSTTPDQQSSTKLDHRVIPNKDGTVTNIVSRAQKQQTILGPAAPLFNVNMLKILNSPSVAHVIKISKTIGTKTLQSAIHSNVAPIAVKNPSRLNNDKNVLVVHKIIPKVPEKIRGSLVNTTAATPKVCAVEKNTFQIDIPSEKVEANDKNINICLKSAREVKEASTSASTSASTQQAVTTKLPVSEEIFEVSYLNETSDQTIETISGTEASSYGLFADLPDIIEHSDSSYENKLDCSLKMHEKLVDPIGKSSKEMTSKDSLVVKETNIAKGSTVGSIKTSSTHSFIQLPIAKTKNIPPILNRSNISQQEEKSSQSFQDMIVLPNTSTSTVTPKIQKVSRRKAPLIIKIPFEEPCFLTSEQLAEMEQSDSPVEKKVRKRKDSISVKKDPKVSKKIVSDIKIVPDIKILPDIKTKESKKIEVPEAEINKSISDEESIVSETKSLDDDSDDTGSESSDSDYKYVNRPTRSGRWPKTIKVVTEEVTTKRRGRPKKKISPPASPDSEKIPYKKRRVSASELKTPEITPVNTEETSPEQSEADSSFSEEPAAEGMPPPGSLIVCKSLNPLNNKETYTVFMVPPNTGGTTLEHNPDGTLQRLSVGSSAVAVLPASNSTTMLPACFASMSSSGQQMSAETLQAMQLIAHNVVNLEAEPQEATTS